MGNSCNWFGTCILKGFFMNIVKIGGTTKNGWNNEGTY